MEYDFFLSDWVWSVFCGAPFYSCDYQTIVFMSTSRILIFILCVAVIIALVAFLFYCWKVRSVNSKINDELDSLSDEQLESKLKEYSTEAFDRIKPLSIRRNARAMMHMIEEKIRQRGE